jgi:hypothetical protein
MCFFFSLMPATICVTIGYFVLFAASTPDGGIKTLSDGGHPKDTTFGKAMKQHATEVAKA